MYRNEYDINMKGTAGKSYQHIFTLWHEGGAIKSQDYMMYK